jgi:hypothetical protein
MDKNLYIQLAPIKLQAGVDENALLAASDIFQASFVEKQGGVIKRLLLKGKDGNYADLVFFESKDAAGRVAEAEQTSQECLEFFKIMEMPDESLPDMGVLSFEPVRSYE